ncbi:hypothetical protein [Flavobacterium sp.]|jgi:hypothetical protein|uniref:hypothetical protein n=1 Tax=Flavobacterium sp. TaxID=239 RepID=UPI0035B2430A
MRYLVRLPKPNILEQREISWTQSFIISGKDRPDNSKYSHLEIRTQLHNISYKKCFYSEVKFATETEGQVDHYVEVSENKNLAFNWDNLFLSHKDSNQGKPSNTNLPNDTTLNPFIHTDDIIENHLSFEDECIRGRTEIGLNTIKKYKLDKDTYNILRSKELRKFEKCLIEILKKTNEEKRQINDYEINILRLFAQPDYSFSLMFRLKLKEHNFI